MSRRDDPYSQVMWRLADEFPEIWADDHALAAYIRLLVSADGAWPSAAAIPAGIPVRTWRALVASTLIHPEPVGHRYKVRGLDKQRDARSSAASKAARKRWGNADRDADRDADRNAQVMPHSTAQHSTADSIGRTRATPLDPTRAASAGLTPVKGTGS